MIPFLFLCLIGYFVYVFAAYSAHRRKVNAIKRAKEEAREARERARYQREYEKRMRLAEEQRIAEERRLEVLRREDPKAYEKEMYMKWVTEQQGMLSQMQNLSTAYATPMSYVSAASQAYYQNQVLNQYQNMAADMQRRSDMLGVIQSSMVSPRVHAKITGIINDY